MAAALNENGEAYKDADGNYIPAPLDADGKPLPVDADGKPIETNSEGENKGDEANPEVGEDGKKIFYRPDGTVA